MPKSRLLKQRDASHPKRLFRLKKSIYGLKQASRQWYIKSNDVITTFSFIENIMDQCIYFKISGSKYIFLILYVNDTLLTSSDSNLLKKTKDFLSKNIEIKDMDETFYVIGIKYSQEYISKNSRECRPRTLRPRRGDEPASPTSPLPNPSSYRTLAQALCRRGQALAAASLLDDILHRGLFLPSPSPSARQHETTTEGCGLGSELVGVAGEERGEVGGAAEPCGELAVLSARRLQSSSRFAYAATHPIPPLPPSPLPFEHENEGERQRSRIARAAAELRGARQRRPISGYAYPARERRGGDAELDNDGADAEDVVVGVGGGGGGRGGAEGRGRSAGRPRWSMSSSKEAATRPSLLRRLRHSRSSTIISRACRAELRGARQRRPI
uniref:Reverse transcriptase Ty1/copia-type domain-containing protein n=1 Tax=Ananas comosus var. bracteatus TaxID=296719 RepID=A0A6V7Q315_ANACO|nr:unnamed protein product [Ananas comosus var. bracteatus]